MRNSTNRVWPEALRARRCPDQFLPDAFQAHARIDDGDRLAHEPHARLGELGVGEGTASRLVRANIKSRFEKRKTNGSLLSTIVTSTASRMGPKGSCSARALVDAQAAEVRALSKCRFNAHRNVLSARPSTSASAVSARTGSRLYAGYPTRSSPSANSCYPPY